ncbi:MAG: hypothetical protein ACJ77M_09785 [Thermoleophilaceae bacterium]
MTLSHHMPLPPELEDVVAELDAARAVPSPDEAGRIHQRVAIRSRPASPMRARIALVSVLVGGVMMSGTGAALALSGESSHGNASAAGYSAPITQSTQPQVLGETQGTTPTTTTEPTTSSTPTSTQPVQVQGVRQVASSNVKSLPFTGLAAIPIILLGVAMMAGGALLRRRLATK